jgi:hypothetical protein
MRGLAKLRGRSLVPLVKTRDFGMTRWLGAARLSQSGNDPEKRLGTITEVALPRMLYKNWFLSSAEDLPAAAFWETLIKSNEKGKQASRFRRIAPENG